MRETHEEIIFTLIAEMVATYNIPICAEVEQLRPWAKQVSAKELEAAQRAVRSLLRVVAGEQAECAQTDNSDDAEQAKRIVDDLRDV